MIKYKIHNIKKSRASTAKVGGKRISLASDEEKVISFTDYKRFESSLNSLKTSGIITCEKLTGEAAKNEPTKIEGNEPTKIEGNEPTKIEGNEPTKIEGNEPTKIEGNEPTKIEGNEPTKIEGNEPTKIEGNDNGENKVPDADTGSNVPDSDANLKPDETKSAPSNKPQKKAGKKSATKGNRSRSRNK